MSILENFIKKARSKHVPLFTTIELTQECNYQCFHCYNYDRRDPLKKPGPVLKDEQVKEILKELKKLGTLYLNFSGGEPLVHKSLDLYIKWAKDLGMQVKLKSNGSLFNDKKIEHLEKIGLDGVEISLYGILDRTYQEFTGNNSAAIVQRNIKLLKKSNIDTTANIILSKSNINELEQMIEFCESNDVGFQISDEITQRYDDTDAIRNNALDSDDYKKLLDGKYAHFFKFCEIDKSNMCGCAKSVLGIGSNGNVYPCIGAPILAGNVNDNSLEYIWKNSKVFNEIRGYKESDFKECEVCDLKKYCSRSSGAAFVNNGDYLGCDFEEKKFAQVRRIKD